MTGVIIQISPHSSELMEIVNKVKCPQCDSIFSNAPNLEMHLIKRHHKNSNYLEKKSEDCVFQYFCPESDCKYFLDSSRDLNELRFFNKMKYLKQHYLKVHTSKNVICEKCQKKFTTERAKQVHLEKECGVEFTCIECKKVYSTYLALMTHCKRKGHILYKVLQDSCKKKLTNDPKSFLRGRQILPRPTELDPMEAATALSELSWKAVVRRGVDASTQTKGRATRCRTKRSWAATQTDSILQPANLLSDFVPSQLFSSATQTNADLMFDLSLLPGEYDSSSPQVNNETQTTGGVMVSGADELPPLLSDTHTQTYIDEEYSHNYTQTYCDDILITDLVRLSDIETQTAWASLNIDPPVAPTAGAHLSAAAAAVACITTTAQTQTLL